MSTKNHHVDSLEPPKLTLKVLIIIIKYPYLTNNFFWLDHMNATYVNPDLFIYLLFFCSFIFSHGFHPILFITFPPFLFFIKSFSLGFSVIESNSKSPFLLFCFFAFILNLYKVPNIHDFVFLINSVRL